MKDKKVLIIVIILLILGTIFIGYKMILNNLEKDIVFTLKGDNEEKIYLNDDYVDSGYVATLKNGNDISNCVTVENKIDNKAIGRYVVKYTLKYKLITKKLERVVLVIKDPAKDISLTLNGDNVIYLLKGKEYVEQGVSAIDILDGDISKSVVIKNTIDNEYVGEYKINYEVINSRNIKKNISRKVIIYDFSYELDIIRNNSMLELKFKTNSNLVKGMLINSSEYLGNSLNLNLFDNNEYFIKIVDVYGNYKEVYYDFIMPSLECTATISIDDVLIETSATDNKKIQGYNYYIDNVKYSSNDNKYSSNIISKDIEVEVYDDSLNKKKTSCKIVDNVPYFDSGLKNSSFENWLYYLYVPENVKQYEEKPLVVFLHGSGERGKDLKLLEKYGFVKYIKNGKKYDNFVLIPQLSSEGTWRSKFDRIIRLIDDVKEKYNIDEKRISISGFSIGAGDIANGMVQYNNHFSCAVLIAPSGRGSSYAQYFKDIPIKVFNGANDSSSYNSTTKGFVNKLKEIGGDVTYTTYEGMGHNVVDKVFSDDEVVKWMVSKRLT